MKIGCSSESFARSIASGELTQLEWLDVCANELEIDGVVFAHAHFPRTDVEYLAQLKKMCADLGLTIAGVSFDAHFWDGPDDTLDLALALGAPLVIAPAPTFVEDAAAWGTFTESVKRRSRAAKARNVTLAVRNVGDTLCTSGDDLRRLAKDIDSSWLRFAFDVTHAADGDAAAALPKTAIAFATLEPAATARASDENAREAIARLARYRGFVILEVAAHETSRDDIHRAVERFQKVRFDALVLPTSSS